MRTIKFRVWGEREGYYYEPVEYVPDGSQLESKNHKFGYSDITEDFFGRDYFKWRDEIREKYYVAEQFTGLKDKNGKDIYEGDLVFVEGQDVFDPGHVVGVYWSEERALFYIGGCKTPLYIMLDKIEVVGNIHENSSLIE